MPEALRLGWRNPAGSVLQGPDSENLRRLFTSLDLWLTFPFVILTNTTLTVPTGADTVIPWATEVSDVQSLHDGTSSTIKCPTQHRSWLAVGAATIRWADSSTAGYREFSWRVGGTAIFQTSVEAPAAARSVRQVLPFMHIVSSSDTMDLIVRHNNGADHALATSRVGCVFLPMGS